MLLSYGTYAWLDLNASGRCTKNINAHQQISQSVSIEERHRASYVRHGAVNNNFLGVR